MKYNFVYDAGMLELVNNFLSEDEIKIVLATIIGKHNAIFYGYKPERLIRAIKRIANPKTFVEQKTFFGIEEGLIDSNGGIMYLKDFDVWTIIEQQFLYSRTKNTEDRESQFIATTSISPSAGVVPDVLCNFDVVYKCVASQQQPTSSEALLHRLEDCILFRSRLRSGHYIHSTTLEILKYWMGWGVLDLIKGKKADNPTYARKIAVVARSLSDVEHSDYTEKEHIQEAEAFYEE